MGVCEGECPDVVKTLEWYGEKTNAGRGVDSITFLKMNVPGKVGTSADAWNFAEGSSALAMSIRNLSQVSPFLFHVWLSTLHYRREPFADKEAV